MTRLSILQTLFPLFFFLLSLSACHKPSVPTKKTAAAPASSGTPTSSTPPGTSVTPTVSNPRPWEKLPLINRDWIKPEFFATVANTEGAIAQFVFSANTVKYAKKLTFKPSTGNYASIFSGRDKNINAIGFYFGFSSHIDKSGDFKSYTYFNGEYINLSKDYSYQSPERYTNIRPSGTSYTLKPTDTWYFIYVFKGKDGKNYQYRSPDMSIANAL